MIFYKAQHFFNKTLITMNTSTFLFKYIYINDDGYCVGILKLLFPFKCIQRFVSQNLIVFSVSQIIFFIYSSFKLIKTFLYFDPMLQLKFNVHFEIPKLFAYQFSNIYM